MPEPTTPNLGTAEIPVIAKVVGVKWDGRDYTYPATISSSHSSGGEGGEAMKCFLGALAAIALVAFIVWLLFGPPLYFYDGYGKASWSNPCLPGYTYVPSRNECV